jgi:hypothetical protein
MGIRHFRVLAEHTEVGRELSAAAVIERVVEGRLLPGRLRLGGIRKPRLTRTEQKISGAARDGLELAGGERAFREPGRGRPQ